MRQQWIDRIYECTRLELGQVAEGYGLISAGLYPQPLPYSPDPYLQARHELGFREGKALLALPEPAGQDH